MIGENKMKRTLAIILSICFVLCLTACNKDNTVSDVMSESSKITSTEKQTSDLTSSNESSESSTTTETSELTESSKSTETSKPTQSSKPINSTHTHSFSAATCTTPQKCSCGETKDSALGHKWQEATCELPKTCSTCKATEGKNADHAVSGDTCKWCKQPIVVSPKNLDKTQTYVHITEDADTITVNSIGFLGQPYIEQTGTFSSNISETTDLNIKINYSGKEYYCVCGGAGIDITYEITETEIIIRDKYDSNEYAVLNLLSDGSVKVISMTNNFKGNWETQIGWIYKPLHTFS